MTTTHTPTPEQLAAELDGLFVNQAAPSREFTIATQNILDAHDELVAALQSIVSKVGPEHGCNFEPTKTCDDIRRIARAALAKVGAP